MERPKIWIAFIEDYPVYRDRDSGSNFRIYPCFTLKQAQKCLEQEYLERKDLDRGNSAPGRLPSYLCDDNEIYKEAHRFRLIHTENYNMYGEIRHLYIQGYPENEQTIIPVDQSKESRLKKILKQKEAIGE